MRDQNRERFRPRRRSSAKRNPGSPRKSSTKREENGFQNRKALKPGTVTKMRKVYEDTLKPHYAETGVLPPYNDAKYQFARTPDEIEGMRKAGLLATEVLDYAESLCKPGVTTEEIDEKV